MSVLTWHRSIVFKWSRPQKITATQDSLKLRQDSGQLILPVQITFVTVRSNYRARYVIRCVLNIVSSLPFLIINDDMTSHSVFGAFANIGFAGTTVHSCTRQAFARLLNALPLNQMTLLCILSPLQRYFVYHTPCSFAQISNIFSTTANFIPPLNPSKFTRHLCCPVWVSQHCKYLVTHSTLTISPVSWDAGIITPVSEQLSLFYQDP
jgi:hypothetical protein